MFLLWAVVIGVLLGYLLGGRISRLANLRLRFLWLIGAALLLQLLIFPLFTDRPIIPVATGALHLLSYGLIFVFFLLNYRIVPLIAIAVGSLLNLLVITVNGGYMPSSPTALARSGAADVAARLVHDGIYGNVVLMSQKTSLNGLGDLLYLPRWIPFATAFSVGDLLVACGLVWLIAWGMRAKESPEAACDADGAEHNRDRGPAEQVRPSKGEDE
jgi:hypothetical protein